MSITEVAIKRPLLITVIFTTLILFGFISYKQLNYNLLPKFEANVIMVQTTYRGASPEEIQNTLTKPIEDAVSAIEGVDQIASTSMEGVSSITVTLKSGTNANNAQRDAERRIDMIRATLADIAAQGYSLNPGRYVGVVPGADLSDEDFQEKLQALNEELVGLNAQARELEETIMGNIASILD